MKTASCGAITSQSSSTSRMSSPGDGGVLFVPGSHKSNCQREEGFFGADSFETADELPPPIVNVTPEAGDVLVMPEALTLGALPRQPEDRVGWSSCGTASRTRPEKPGNRMSPRTTGLTTRKNGTKPYLLTSARFSGNERRASIRILFRRARPRVFGLWFGRFLFTGAWFFLTRVVRGTGGCTGVRALCGACRTCPRRLFDHRNFFLQLAFG